jgi:molybdopterin converting factor small subunit
MLRGATAGEKVVRASGESVRDVLDDVSSRYPAFNQGLFGPDGQLRQFVNVYLNDEDIRYLGKLDARVHDGDTLSILPAVAGGA